jgi:hypothetical protein
MRDKKTRQKVVVGKMRSPGPRMTPPACRLFPDSCPSGQTSLNFGLRVYALSFGFSRGKLIALRCRSVWGTREVSTIHLALAGGVGNDGG